MRLSRLAALGGFLPAVLLGQSPATTPTPTRVRANWELAEKFNPEAMRRVTYSTSVAARFIGKTDSVWYNWRDQAGTRFMLVFPPLKVKQPLFDHVKLAAALATAHKKPYEPNRLPFTTLNFTKDHKAIRFTVDTVRYEWSLAGESLRALGRPPRG
ncbi:MAG: hypothetical protein JNJ98_20080, partial [Gemmatimonadetes bacterium]|nr:hypothetical protein [Gemmatimonadota bacterium]